MQKTLLPMQFAIDQDRVWLEEMLFELYILCGIAENCGYWDDEGGGRYWDFIRYPKDVPHAYRHGENSPELSVTFRNRDGIILVSDPAETWRIGFREMQWAQHEEDGPFVRGEETWFGLPAIQFLEGSFCNLKAYLMIEKLIR